MSQVRVLHEQVFFLWNETTQVCCFVWFESLRMNLLGRCSTTEIPRQLNGWAEPRQLNGWAESRQLNGWAESRQLNGWAESRQLSSWAESR